MKPSTFLKLTSIVLLYAASAHGLADTAKTIPKLAEPVGGTPIAGLCMIARDVVLDRSKAGMSATARLIELSQIVQTELAPEKKKLDEEVQKLHAFQKDQPKLFNEQRAQRQKSINEKAEQLRREIAQMEQEIEATRVKALAMISKEAQPLIESIYKKKSCGLVIDRGLVYGGNMSNDLTADVVAALDAKLSTVTFERERLTLAPAPANNP